MTGATGIVTAVTIDCGLWAEALPGAAGLVETAARAALAAACPRLGAAEISLLFADDARLRELNRDWRGKDAPTNVLSFPATRTVAGETPAPEFAGVPLELGDVALAFETCRAEADRQAKPLADHVAHLVVHGVLHLVGYDHETTEEARVMEGLERAVLAGLGVADPYGGEEGNV
jgi:probable rRNA maturation factor